MTPFSELEAHLLELEAELHQQAVRADAARLGELLEDEFFEFGVSGTVWNKQGVIDALRGEPFSARSISDFKLTPLADDVMLVTYRAQRSATSQRPAAESLRSSIWRRRSGVWRMLFHQATLA
jgi:glyoxylase I family protein